MLRLLERYEVSATWALVGHLFLDACERDASGRVHDDIVHPRQSHVDADWFHADPASDRADAPLWYGTDVLDAILDAGQPQEIACHSFSHPQFGDPAMTLDAARSDLAACVRLATERGIRLRVVRLPAQQRGPPCRPAGSRLPGLPRPRPDLGSHVLRRPSADPPISPTRHSASRRRSSRPTEHLPGLWRVPGSALLMGTVGVRRYVPAGARIHKAKARLQAAPPSRTACSTCGRTHSTCPRTATT